MNIQKRLYASVERKLVLWCIAAMLLMSTSFIIPVYLVVSNWLDHSGVSMREAHHGLLLTLLIVQVIVVAIGAALSLVFAKKALRPIRKAHQDQADFATDAHHQLRTPIAVMQAEVDTALLRKGQQPEDYKRVLKSLVDELGALRATSEQLLLQADGISTKELHDTSKDIEGILPVLERRYGMRIKTTITPDIYTSLSRQEWTICLETLLENSFKHAGKQPDELQVTISLGTDGQLTRLTYHDNGNGVAKGEEKRLFERGFRGKRSVDDSIHGSGLGLAILSNIIQAHDGSLAANNMPTGGLKITVSLPRQYKR